MSSMNTAQAAAKREQERLEREQRRRERMMGLFGTPGPSSPQRRAMQDEARVAAANESYRRQDEAAQRRSARIAAAKRDGTFDEIRSGYNKVQGQFMDEAGNIYSQSAYSPAQWAAITKSPAKSVPVSAPTAAPSASPSRLPSFANAEPITGSTVSTGLTTNAAKPASSGTRLPAPATPPTPPATDAPEVSWVQPIVDPVVTMVQPLPAPAKARPAVSKRVPLPRTSNRLPAQAPSQVTGPHGALGLGKPSVGADGFIKKPEFVEAPAGSGMTDEQYTAKLRRNALLAEVRNGARYSRGLI